MNNNILINDNKSNLKEGNNEKSINESLMNDNNNILINASEFSRNKKKKK